MEDLKTAQLGRQGEEGVVERGRLSHGRSINALAISHAVRPVNSLSFSWQKLLHRIEGRMCVCLFHGGREQRVILEHGEICEVGHLYLKWRPVVEKLMWLKKLQGLRRGE